MVQSIEQSVKSEVLMTTTYHLLQWLSQYNYTSRVLAIFRSVSLPNQKELKDRIKEMVTKFSDKSKSQNTAFVLLS